MKKRGLLPKAGSGLEVKMKHLRAGLGFNSNVMPWPIMAGKMSKPDISVNSTLGPVDRDVANLEAEEGEVAVVPGKGGVPSTFKIGGERHHSGGTPLNLPPNSFIYSDTRDMRIKDEDIQKQFGMPYRKAGYTPAEIAKKYNINNFKKILADPDTDDLQRKTAEGMIANYNLKLAKLALIQESMKGFPQGIPQVAMPYIEQLQIDPTEFVQADVTQDGQEPTPDDEDQMAYGGIISELQSRKMGGAHDYFAEGGYKEPGFATPDQKVVFNTKTGEYEIKDARGRKIGVIDVPSTYERKKKGGQVDLPKAQTGTQVPDKKAIAQKSYNKLLEALADKDLQQDIYTNYLKEVANIKDPVIREKALAADKDKVIDNLIKLQKQNHDIYASDIDLKKDSVVWDKSSVADKSGKRWAKNEKYKTTMKSLGYKPEDILNTDEDIAIAQAAYNSTRKTFDSDKHKEKLGSKFVGLTGKEDEKYDPSAAALSAPDTFYGNTTAGQLLKYRDEPEVLPGPELKDEKKNYTPNDPTQAEHLGPNYRGPAPAWWLQDIIKTGQAASDLARVKKYMPWQAVPEFVTPNTYFKSPERALAASAERVNIAGNILGQYGDPRTFNARFNQIQGQGFKEAADILGAYHDSNIDIANQRDAVNTQIMNQNAEIKANLATNLWDKYQTVNHMYDKAKSDARAVLVNQVTQAITNRANTYNMNTMFPQFAVNPMVGGMVYEHDPRKFKPSYAAKEDIGKVYERILTEHPTLKNDPKLAMDMAKIQYGVKSEQNDYDAYTQFQKNRGIVSQYSNNQDKDE